ncbi:MAG: SCO family protein [Hyphomicrobiales bacterium]|nr:SCO family protein [Hyphomicrobiales bacterium]
MRSVVKALQRILPTLFVAAAGFAFLWHATDGFGAFTAEAARRQKIERDPVYVAETELTDYTGRSISLSGGGDSITLVEFIYATCPTICQTAGSDFFRLRERLHSSGLADKVRMISVSFDPQRDDNENLSGYAKLHGADGAVWTIARPHLRDVPRLLKTFGVTIIADGFDGYQHNTAIHIIDQSGRLVAIVDTDDISGAAAVVESLL